MATRIRFQHEGLRNYLAEATPPPAAPAPGLNPRRPLQRPDGPVPPGVRPIPTSSQGPKRTNAQIPYARQAATSLEECGTAGLPEEGDVVFAVRAPHYSGGTPRERAGVATTKQSGTGALVKVLTVEQVNERLEREAAVTVDAIYDLETFPYSLDGVVNNVDGLDEENEFKDHAIANVAIQGHVRLDHSEGKRCCMRRTLPGSHLHVGLVAVPQLEANGKIKTNDDGDALFKHRLERFSSMMITSGDYNPLFVFNPDGTRINKAKRPFMTAAWVLGVVTDSNQSPNMLRIHVDVRPIRYVHRPADLPPNADSPHTELKGRPLIADKVLFSRAVLVIGLQLLLRWFNPTNPRCSIGPYDPNKPQGIPTGEDEGCYASYTMDRLYTDLVAMEDSSDTTTYDARAKLMRERFDPRH